MVIVYAIGRALVIGFIGMFIAYQGRQLNIPIFNLQGRINRVQFIIGYMGLMIVFHILGSFYQNMINIIVTLPAYWGLRLFIGLCQALIFPLLCTVLARRLQDLNAPALPALIWPFFITFVYTYNALPSTSITLHSILAFVAFLLMILPGDKRKNKFGLPPESIRRKQRRDKENLAHRKAVISKNK